MTGREPLDQPGDDRYLNILSVLPDLVVAVDGALNLQFMNRPQGGYRPDQVLGRSILDFMDPNFRSQVRDLIEGVFRSGISARYEIPAIDAAGNRQWHEGTITPLLRDGLVAAAVISTTNVTARRLAQEEAKKLRRMVPICAWCHKIRSDEGFWSRLESYIEESSGAPPTHSMCPECETKMLKDLP